MKKTIKKMMSLALAFILTATVFTGCASKSASSQAIAGSNGNVTIQWWTPNWDEPESREMAAEFEAANPGIKVELVITDWDTYKSKITTAISTNNAPELSTVLTTDVAPLAKQGLLASLNELAPAAGVKMEDILKPALDIATVDGKTYGIPFRHDGSGIYYNVDLLKAAGYDSFPATWDEMTEMSKKVTNGTVTAFAWPLGNQANATTRLVQQLYTYGGDVLNEDETKCLLDSDAGKKAMGNIVNSIKEGYASASSMEIDNTKMRDMFGSGQLAFNLTGPFDLDTLKTDYPNLNFKTAVIPGDGGMGCTTSNGWTIVMAEKSKNKEAAAKLLAYLTTPENQARLTDSLPASYEALKYPQYSSEELTPFAKQLDNSRPEPTYTRWAEMEPIIYQYMQAAIAGSMSVEEACNAMTADINTLIAD
ncbi:sugar ABC transporter substrate-binding protein [Hydrogenoanaerobacterium sp.]|uniref:ABC transporter substrate-binding protein n=1 Tax=Hydrogenoanaerobacterium sp. TaxID=2953763 RepID=UPI002897F2F2|nr:sugar ABC transporter substrate-binding protein [Hydrogenoanaerobacterium sp.]